MEFFQIGDKKIKKMEEAAAEAEVDMKDPDKAEVDMKDIVENELQNLGKRAKRRLERIQYQKEKKKQKKAAKREEREKLLKENPRKVCPRARGVDADPAIAEKHRQRNRAIKDAIRNKIVEDAKEGPVIVFDMSVEWELAMTVAERASLAQQFMYAYGANKRCVKPARLLITGLPEDGIVDRALHKHSGNQNWLAFSSSHRLLEDHLESLTKCGLSLEESTESASETLLESVKAGTSDDCSQGRELQAPLTELKGKADIYYLTADTDNVLEDVPWNNQTVFVIGAIVDRNRMTRAAVMRAEKLNIKPVCLPIDKYCDMTATKVLTVNHCVELLQRRGCGESWESAFEKTLPTRKEVVVKGQCADSEAIARQGETSEEVVSNEEVPGQASGDGVTSNRLSRKRDNQIDPSFSRDLTGL